MADSADEKTEKATPKKREDERKKGNIFQSSDVVSALSVLAVFLALRMAMPYIYRSVSNLVTVYFGYAGTRNFLDEKFVLDVNRQMWISIILLSAPVLLASAGLRS